MSAFLMDIWHTIHSILTTSDLITLGIMAVVAIGAGFMMQSFGSIVTTTLVALVAFALVGYVRAVTLGGRTRRPMPDGRLAGVPESSHAAAAELIRRVVIFAVVIAVAHAATVV